MLIADRRASTSYLQRKLKIGYKKAASLIERLERDGVISAPDASGKRTVLIDA
jgi:S-DNA-T family DNA segregation ATPase FtsK/SpoIIIE